MSDDTGERPPDELHGSHFAIVPEWLLAESSDVVKLAAILDRYAGKDGQLWPGQATLAERMECSDRHVRKLLARMKEIGALEVVRRRFNGSTIYRLVKERPEPPFLTDRNGGSTLTGTDVPPNESHITKAKEPIAAESKSSKRSRQTSFPPPGAFVLTDAMKAWAAKETPTVDVVLQTKQFADHWRGKGEKRADWVATWRTWMRNAEAWGKPGRKNNPPPTGTTSNTRTFENEEEYDAWIATQK